MTGAFDLTDHVALVTGGNSGIGLGYAEGLAAAGASVAVWGTNEEKNGAAAEQLRTHGRSVVALRCDVGDEAQVDEAFARTVEALGRVDSCFANAGVGGAAASFAEMSMDEWRRVLRVNLDGVFLTIKAVEKPMREAGYGRIVNIASVAGKEGNPSAPAYSASKAGVIALTKSLGKELARSGVLVNCVTPGAVRTAIFDQMSDEHVQFMLSKIPMGRFGQADEIAALVAWLCTEECSFSTGAVFDLSGGRATY